MRKNVSYVEVRPFLTRNRNVYLLWVIHRFHNQSYIQQDFDEGIWRSISVRSSILQWKFLSFSWVLRWLSFWPSNIRKRTTSDSLFDCHMYKVLIVLFATYCHCCYLNVIFCSIIDYLVSRTIPVGGMAIKITGRGIHMGKSHSVGCNFVATFKVS